MKRSTDRILTTHVGRLERPDDITRVMEANGHSRPRDPAFTARLAQAVNDVVRQQAETGIDVITDGEFGKLSWIAYQHSRLSGYELKPLPAAGRFAPRGRDRSEFATFYSELEAPGRTYFFKSPGSDSALDVEWVCTGPLAYTGEHALQEDIANLRAAAAEAGVVEAFMPATGPMKLGRDDYYGTNDAYMAAVGEAMRREYLAIVESGLLLQIDDPGLTVEWEAQAEQPTVADYRKRVAQRIELLNHLLRGIPADRVRYHVCWGSWHGPHAHDLPLAHIADLLMTLNVQAYVIEAGNARHEHEWMVWRDMKLPDGKILIPGVVSHATNVVEHPELVAWRIANFASAVGRENVIAGTDCGLGYRVHDQIAWAKLKALAEGARLASKQLWR
jgi:5-methyltetrahydropteroyltriglutamate--homocysteine methyltransferase